MFNSIPSSLTHDLWNWLPPAYNHCVYDVICVFIILSIFSRILQIAGKSSILNNTKLQSLLKGTFLRNHFLLFKSQVVFLLTYEKKEKRLLLNFHKNDIERQKF